jgi:predicted HTH transcriptional regulator
MLTIIFYIVVVTVAFVLGRSSVKHAIPLTIYELQELRRERTNSIYQRIEKSKNRLMDFAFENGTITNDDVEDILLVSDSTAGRYLHELVIEGRLVMLGQGSATHYVPRQREL